MIVLGLMLRFVCLGSDPKTLLHLAGVGDVGTSVTFCGEQHVTFVGF